MKKLKILCLALTVAVTCGILAACANPNVEKYAGEYQMNSFTDSGQNFTFEDFSYLRLTLFKNGSYTFEYSFSADFTLPEGVEVPLRYTESGRFSVNEEKSEITCDRGMLKGTHSVSTVIVRLKFTMAENKCMVVLTKAGLGE